MKTFTVVWTYIANYHVMAVKAESAEHAMKMCAGFYDVNPDFKKKADVYVFEGKPAWTRLHGEVTELKESNL